MQARLRMVKRARFAAAARVEVALFLEQVQVQPISVIIRPDLVLPKYLVVLVLHRHAATCCASSRLRDCAAHPRKQQQ